MMTAHSRRTLLDRSPAIAMLATLATLTACGSNAATDSPEPTAPAPELRATEPSPAPPPPPERAPAPDATRQHLHLGRLAHLAARDLGPAGGGLYIDFGTSAARRFTTGRWKSGFHPDEADEGITYAPFAQLARIFLPTRAPADEGLRVTLEVRARVNTRLLAFVNGVDVGGGPISADGEFHRFTLDVPAEAIRPGESQLLLRSESGGDSPSIDLADLFVHPTGTAAPERAPAIAARVDANRNRDALLVPIGGALSYALPLPEGATLVLGAARADAGASRTVREGADEPGTEGDPAGARAGDEENDAGLDLILARDGADNVTLESVRLPRGAPWRDLQIDLAAYAGEHVRLELRANGAGVALSDLRIVTPAPVETPLADTARNVIVLTIDTLRASKLQLYNPDSRVRTPALDAFAESAVLFERAQSASNWTKPSVASLLTSLYPSTHGATSHTASLPNDARTIGEVLQGEGFRTAMFSANGYVSDRFGMSQGFATYTNYIREERRSDAATVFREAGDWIERQRRAQERSRENGESERRFFAYIQTIDPHVPYDPPDEFLEMYWEGDYGGTIRNNRNTGVMLDRIKRTRQPLSDEDRRRLEALHDAEISYHDHHFARFLARLTELGVDEDTLFVITSDHGEEFQEHGSWGHGHSVYQELLHIPLMMRWPGVIPAGTRTPHTVSTLDLPPTLIEALGVNPQSTFAGRSLLGYARGVPPAGPSVAFSEHEDARRVIRSGDAKLILRGNGTAVLFDLGADPGEERELGAVDRPITWEALRSLSGVFLGAPDRRGWILGRDGDARTLRSSEVRMTRELCIQLRLLGYIVGDCEAMPSEADLRAGAGPSEPNR